MALQSNMRRNFSRSIMHNLINATWKNGKEVPHQWYFTNIFYKRELLANPKLAEAFMVYTNQYYPDYQFRYEYFDNCLRTVFNEAAHHDFEFGKKYELGFNEEESVLAQAMKFGDIVTDFFIRYLNYDLITCCGQNIF